MRTTTRHAFLALAIWGATVGLAAASQAAPTIVDPREPAVSTTPPAPAAKTPGDAISVATGSFSIGTDGAVTGTLPYGFSLADPPSDPADPSMREKIVRGNKDHLKILDRADFAPVATRSATTASKSGYKNARRSQFLEHVAGCVHMQGSGDPYGNFTYHGYMTACSSGPLWCHEYRNVNFGGAWDYIEDTPANSGSGGYCGLPTIAFWSSNFANASWAREIFYTHGKNSRTNGDDTTFIEFGKGV